MSPTRPLRASRCGPGLDDGPAVVLRMDPPDGATGVFRDTAVVASLSHPTDSALLPEDAMRVEDEDCRLVPGRLRLSPDGTVLVWTAAVLLRPATAHVVTTSGLRDVRGREVGPYRGRFVTCDLAAADLPG